MRPTDKTYYSDEYQSQFSATVTACERSGNNWHIILDKTCFYPEGGGQPGDTGFINDVPVLDCRFIAQELVHITESPITIGATVHGKIDFLRRFTFMQNHTGEHIISGIVKELHGFTNVGFHLSPNNMTMDFNGELSKDQLEEVEMLANNAIYQNIPLEINIINSATLESLNMDYRSKKALQGDVRIVNIPQYDLCACAGLHVRSTGEVGSVKIISAQRYKGGVRIYALCGRDALADYCEKNENILKISAMLSVKPADAVTATEKLLSNINSQKKLISDLKSELFKLKAQAYEEGTPIACAFEDNLEPDDLRSLASEIASRASVAFVLSPNDDSSCLYKYAICSQTPSINLTEISKYFNAALKGRGGVKNGIAQGIVNAPKQTIKEYLYNNLKGF